MDRKASMHPKIQMNEAIPTVTQTAQGAPSAWMPPIPTLNAIKFIYDAATQVLFCNKEITIVQT